MKRFLVDNQLPAALSRWLQAKGCEAEHVLALQMGQASDETIWARAAAEEATIISKDEDFARMTVMRPENVTVIWLRMGNCRTATLLTTMERVWPDVLRELESGARIVEVF